MFKFKNSPSCRVCKHNHYWVLENYEIRNCATKSCKCRAKNWIPLDNLEYLEGLSENKK